MAQTTLVEPAAGLDYSLRVSGRNILNRLDGMNVPVQAALWQFDDEGGSWRLRIVTPLTDSKGPLYVYHLLQDILGRMTAEEREELELTDISVVSPQSLQIRELLRQYGTVETEDTRRVRRSEGPHIYRLAAK